MGEAANLGTIHTPEKAKGIINYSKVSWQPGDPGAPGAGKQFGGTTSHGRCLGCKAKGPERCLGTAASPHPHESAGDSPGGI